MQKRTTPVKKERKANQLMRLDFRDKLLPLLMRVLRLLASYDLRREGSFRTKFNAPRFFFPVCTKYWNWEQSARSRGSQTSLSITFWDFLSVE